MYSLATEIEDDPYAPEQLNRAIKDWIESFELQEDVDLLCLNEVDPVGVGGSNSPSATTINDLKRAKFPFLSTTFDSTDRGSSSRTSSEIATTTTKPLAIEVNSIQDEKMIQNVPSSDEFSSRYTNSTRFSQRYVKPQSQSVDSLLTPTGAVIQSSISMKSYRRYGFCCYIPTKGHCALCCFGCVLCFPCYLREVYLPSHTFQILTCEGAGSYYTTASTDEIRISPQYALCFDLVCFGCCGHYYCCVWDWIIDGQFACHCGKCNNQYIDIHRDIYNFSREICGMLLFSQR